MKWVFGIFVGLYVCAVCLFLVGTFGWFGQDRDPLSGVFLIPLGLPWNMLGDAIGLAGTWLGLLAPLVNAGLLFWLWRRA